MRGGERGAERREERVLLEDDSAQAGSGVGITMADLDRPECSEIAQPQIK